MNEVFEQLMPMLGIFGGATGIIAAMVMVWRMKKIAAIAAKNAVLESAALVQSTARRAVSDTMDGIKAKVSVEIEQLAEARLQTIADRTNAWQANLNVAQIQAVTILTDIVKILAKQPQVTKAMREEVMTNVEKCMGTLGLIVQKEIQTEAVVEFEAAPTFETNKPKLKRG